MPRNICGICLPRHEHLICYDTEELPACILPDYHEGPHLVVNKRGVYSHWETDYECDCCKPDERECFVSWQIKGSEAMKLIVEKRDG
jgi:hypothetical protein